MGGGGLMAHFWQQFWHFWHIALIKQKDVRSEKTAKWTFKIDFDNKRICLLNTIIFINLLKLKVGQQGLANRIEIDFQNKSQNSYKIELYKS